MGSGADLGDDSLGAAGILLVVLVVRAVVLLGVLVLGVLVDLSLVILVLSNLGILDLLRALVLVVNGVTGLLVLILGNLGSLCLLVLNLGGLGSLWLGGFDLGSLGLGLGVFHTLAILDLLVFSIADLGNLWLGSLDLGGLSVGLGLVVLLAVSQSNLGRLGGLNRSVLNLGHLGSVLRDQAARSILSRSGSRNLLRRASLVKDKQLITTSRNLGSGNLEELAGGGLRVIGKTVEEAQTRVVGLGKSLTVLSSSCGSLFVRLDIVIRRTSGSTVTLGRATDKNVLGNGSPRLTGGRGRSGNMVGCTLLVKDVQTILASRNLEGLDVEKKAAGMRCALDQSDDGFCHHKKRVLEQLSHTHSYPTPEDLIFQTYSGAYLQPYIQ